MHCYKQRISLGAEQHHPSGWCCSLSKSKRKTAAGHRNNVYTLLDLTNPEVYRDLTPPEELPLFIGEELPL